MNFCILEFIEISFYLSFVSVRYYWSERLFDLV